MRILIGYDGSPTANAALNDLARAGLPDKGEMIVLSCAETFHAADIDSEPVILNGNPKELFCEEAERRQVDCIFVGATGHSELARLLIGSASLSTAIHARCSVEIVRKRANNPLDLQESSL